MLAPCLYDTSIPEALNHLDRIIIDIILHHRIITIVAKVRVPMLVTIFSNCNILVIVSMVLGKATHNT
jgi:hypothetical protein